ncbi:hypothetical protein JH67_03020 [Listeria monocytogenes]|nr:hypothetical protein [Listeria monocytogenes]
MNYIQGDLYAYKVVGKDVLQNPIKQKELLFSPVGRLSRWKAEEIKIDARRANKTARKFITDAEFSACENAAFFYYEGITYEIVASAAVGRKTVLDLEVYAYDEIGMAGD